MRHTKEIEAMKTKVAEMGHVTRRMSAIRPEAFTPEAIAIDAVLEVLRAQQPHLNVARLEGEGMVASRRGFANYALGGETKAPPSADTVRPGRRA